MESPFIVKREVKRVAIVVFASNTSLCGGFNANIIRHLTVILDEYKSLGMENVLLYPVGRKVAEGVKKLGFKAEGDFQHMAEAAALAEDLMRRFLHRDIDKVELLYNHFRSTAVQVLTRETYLPIDLTQEKKEEDKGRIPDYIVEPSVDVVMRELLPKVLRMKMFTVLLDSNASEHAARTMAMQIATDNANDLLQDLTVMYNKSRQQAITNELLDSRRFNGLIFFLGARYAASCPKNLNIMRQVYRNLSISVIPSIEGGLNNHSAPPL